jgi:signal transduction histidine kinase/ActR/RegA family two-component response regulator
MLVIYLVMMGMISRRLYAAVTESLSLRYDNLDLLSNLTQARQDLEERVQERTAELAKSEAALRDADSRKNEFLAMLGHELRNPLAPIRTALQIMHMPGVQNSTIKWAGEVIDRQTTRLTRLVDDLLDVSRIAHGKISLQEDILDIATVVHQAVEASLPLIEARHQKLSVRIPEEPLSVKGDLVRLDQVISNLLNNAAKYSDTGKDIELAVSGSEQWVTVRVQDHGIGIPGDMLPYVFDLFTQADHSLARTQGGLGIGLTLVKRLVEMHGGRVEAYSDGVGRGSRFLVHLPRLPSPVETERRFQSRAPDNPSRILIVDDNVDAVDCLAHLLRLEGHTVATAHDGVSGLSEAGKFQPHVVLLDIGMPDMDGFQVAKELRASKPAKPMLIIALTGYGQPEDRARAEAAGFDELLTKPVNLDGLRAALKTPWSPRNGT